MSDPNFSAIRAKLRYETIEDFIKGYSRFISGGGMFIPMRPANLKPIGTTIRFQFLLGDGSTAMLGEGMVLQVREPSKANPRSPVGMLVKFTKLSQESKSLVDRVLSEKSAAIRPNSSEPATATKHPTKPFPEEEAEESPSKESEGTAEINRGIVDAAHRAAQAANEALNDQTPMPPQPPEFEDEAVAAVPNRESVETPVSNGYLEDLLSDELEDDAAPAEASAEPLGTELNFDEEESELSLDSDLQEEIEPEPAEELEPAEEPAAEAVELSFDPEPEPEFILDLGLDDDEEEPPEDLTAAEPSTREAPEASDVVTAETPSEPETRETEGLVEEGSHVHPTKLGETEGGLQIMAFDESDVSEEAMKALENFSFDAVEDEIDGMFDGLFGSSQAEDDFFSALGGPATPAPTTGDSLSSVEFELPVEEDDEPSSADISMEDAFSSEAEDDLDLGPDFEDPAPAPETEALESEAILSSDSDSSWAMTGSDPAVDPVVPYAEQAELGDESSPVLDLKEADEEDLFLDNALGFSAAAAASASEPEEGRHEIDDLLGNLDVEDSEPQELTLHLGGVEPEPEVDELDDEESLEALLASAQREIDEKHPPPPTPSGDIIDQLLGDDNNLPLPPVAPAFELQPKKKEKKGFMSKLFGKD